MRLRPEQLASALARGLAPIYLVFGDQPLLVQEAADAVRAATRAAGIETRECLDVEPKFDWSRLRATGDSLSLFGGRRLVELRLADHRPGDAGGKALRAWSASPAPDTVLLITAGKLDSAAQKSAWFGALDRAGAVVQVWPVARGELSGWIAQRLRAHGLQPSREAADLLARQLEGNLLAAAQEVEKLALLYPAGPLELAQVLEAVGDSARYSVYDLVDAAFGGEPARVLRVLEAVRGEGLEPPLVIWALHRELETVVSLAAEVERGVPVDAALGRARVWEKRKPVLRRALRNLDAAGWRRLLALAARAERRAKGAEAGDPWASIVELTLAMAARPLPVALRN